MKSKLPILTLLVAGLIAAAAYSQNQAPSLPAPPAVSPSQIMPEETRDDGRGATGEGATPGKPLVREAISRLGRYQSISARLRHRVDLFGKQLVGTGTYLQGPPDSHWMRMELKLQVAGEMALVQQVSDGQTLWIYQRVLDNSRVNRVDLRKLLQAWEQVNAERRADGASPLVDSRGKLLLGGIRKILVQLDDAFEFERVEPWQLGSLPVWVLHGRWKPDRLAQWLPESDRPQEGSPLNLLALRQPLPEQVLLTLGRADLFPYRIEYRRGGEPDKQPFQHGQSMVALELYDVRVDIPLERNAFLYTPGNVQVVDRTEKYLEKLGER